MTHQTLDHITKRHQSSIPLLADSQHGSKASVGVSGGGSTSPPGHGMFGAGLRGIQGLGSIVAGLITEDNTVRTSYDSTLTNLKILKKKCIPRDHVVILPVNPVDVKIRIATSLQMPPTSVDFALHQAIFSLCDGQSFWLGELIIHMLEHGMVEFTTQLQVEGVFFTSPSYCSSTNFLHLHLHLYSLPSQLYNTH